MTWKSVVIEIIEVLYAKNVINTREWKTLREIVEAEGAKDAV